MVSTKQGVKAPKFKGNCTGEGTVSLLELRGKKVVLYFYPKDNTSGCIKEGQDFRDLYKDFLKENTVIYGLSRESIKSHENFKEKQSFPFDLISDPQEKICKLFDVIKEKSMYGRKYMGIERSTFLIGEDGKLVKEWRKVRVPDHAKEVLQTIKAMT